MPHVDLDGLARADRLDLALLDGAQELDLRRRRQFADLVEEQRAARGFDEFADMALGGAGERALLVAEQDRLDEVFRHRAAIHRDERLCPPLAGAVDGARDQFLADAGFAGDQHRDGRGRGLLRHADDARASTALLVMMSLKPSVPDWLFFIRCQFAFERAGVERVAQADMQPLGADRLDHEIDRAGAHRRDHIVDAAMRGLHDHRHVDRRLAHFGEHAEPVEIRHHQIEDHAIDPRAVRARRAAPAPRRRCRASTSRIRTCAACLRAAGTAPDRRRQ